MKPFVLSSYCRRGAVLTILVVIAYATPSWANPDLVGSWQLSLEKSDQRREGRPLVETTMAIELVGEDVRVTRTFPNGQSFTVTYVTDGDKREIVTPFGSQNLRAQWKKDKLALSYTISRPTPRGAFELDVVETWSLKKGELVVAYSTRVGERPMIRREIYLPSAP